MTETTNDSVDDVTSAAKHLEELLSTGTSAAELQEARDALTLAIRKTVDAGNPNPQEAPQLVEDAIEEHRELFETSLARIKFLQRQADVPVHRRRNGGGSVDTTPLNITKLSQEVETRAPYLFWQKCAVAQAKVSNGMMKWEIGGGSLEHLENVTREYYACFGYLTDDEIRSICAGSRTPDEDHQKRERLTAARKQCQTFLKGSIAVSTIYRIAWSEYSGPLLLPIISSQVRCMLSRDFANFVTKIREHTRKPRSVLRNRYIMWANANDRQLGLVATLLTGEESGSDYELALAQARLAMTWCQERLKEESRQWDIERISCPVALDCPPWIAVPPDPRCVAEAEPRIEPQRSEGVLTKTTPPASGPTFEELLALSHKELAQRCLELLRRVPKEE